MCVCGYRYVCLCMCVCVCVCVCVCARSLLSIWKKKNKGVIFFCVQYSSSTMPKTPTDTSESQVEGLRFENSRLKVALASR